MSSNSFNSIDDYPVRLPIRLGQFLKLANLVEDGATARLAIQSGDVRVNNKVEVRRGSHLQAGDVVSVDYGYETVSIRVAEQSA